MQVIMFIECLHLLTSSDEDLRLVLLKKEKEISQ
jgi:hypothetical protein